MTKNYDLMIACKSDTISNYLIVINTFSDGSMLLTVLNTTDGRIVRSANEIECKPLLNVINDFLAIASYDDFDLVNSDNSLTYQKYVELIACLVSSCVFQVTLQFDEITLEDIRVH